MKMICPLCEGSGQIDHMEVKTDGDSTFYRCLRCGIITNYEYICDCITHVGGSPTDDDQEKQS